MKKTKLIALAAACALTLTAFPLFVRGDEPVYDPESDPLITLSYITEILTPEFNTKIGDLTKVFIELDAKNTKLTEENTALKEDLSTLAELNASLIAKQTELEEAIKEIKEQTSQTTTQSGYEVVYLKQNAKLMAKSPCEIILRSGKAIVVSIISNGVNDITTGDELLNAADVPLYHCLLVPRGNDGRGIQITTADAYVMVRGEYEIVE